jgi:hypothetical protein
VVRKGATPAFPGQRGFVGGSMGDDAIIIEGVESPQARASLYSTVHGAGRLFGRKEAKRRFTREQMDWWLQDRGVTLGRRRPGRKPDGLPPPARSDRATRRDGEGAAHPAAICSGDGGDAGARSLEGLAHELFLLSIASAESLSKVGYLMLAI